MSSAGKATKICASDNSESQTGATSGTVSPEQRDAAGTKHDPQEFKRLFSSMLTRFDRVVKEAAKKSD